MAHNVRMKMTTNVAARKDIEVSVSDSLGKVGTLLISKGNIEVASRMEIGQEVLIQVAQICGDEGEPRYGEEEIQEGVMASRPPLARW